MLYMLLLLVMIVLVCVVISAVGRSRKLTNLQIEQMNRHSGAATTPAPPAEDRYERLAKLKRLLDDGVLTQEEFERERERTLNDGMPR